MMKYDDPMKTVVNIPKSLLNELKKRALRNGQSLSQTVAGVLEKGLKKQTIRTRIRKLPAFDCGKVLVNIADQDRLIEQ